MAKLVLMHGQSALAQHFFKPSELTVGSVWIPADGTVRRVTIEEIDVERGEVTYRDNRTEKRYEKDSFSFQTRYCLVVNDPGKFAHLLKSSEPVC